ncbi:OLC1v1022609C1 [Oldenlandia corymbosa var. corymbosa]|uniref:OLC1v1022609C1 n=1 Tax=Oldenlandia corymbosa var. corymbosa TaxID=529605 RepID=A0AAV1BY72_OLDCO|nr:OLC1v1022609C1 [Oldenlandia corymbosa var. corymbosa]
MDEGLKKHFSVFSTVVVSLCHCYFISSRFPKGFLRFISLLPILCIFSILPLYLPFPSVFFTSLTTFSITWLGNFKLLLFAFGQGPLSSDRASKSLHIFIASAALPIRTKPGTNNPSSSSSDLISKPKKKIPIMTNLGFEILASAILIRLFLLNNGKIHPRILLIGYCFLVYFMVDCVIASSSLLVHALIGLELEPSSDEPYASTSLQEFWGKRWNLAVTNILRETVYKPVRSASAKVLGRELSSLPAVLASFVVSGLMHEILFFYATRVDPSWEQTSFFVLHGICVVLEIGFKKALNGRWRLPWFVSGPLTVGFVVSTSFWLFFPPLINSRADVMVLEEFRIFGEFVRDRILNRLVSFWP